MLDFVNLAGAGRRGLRWRRQTRLDIAQPTAGTLTHNDTGVVRVFSATNTRHARIRPSHIRPNSRVRKHNTRTPPVALCRPELASR